MNVCWFDLWFHTNKKYVEISFPQKFPLVCTKLIYTVESWNDYVSMYSRIDPNGALFFISFPIKPVIKLILCYIFSSFIAWSKSCSISCYNFERRWEKGMAHLGLGEHHSREPVTAGISCKLDSVWTSAPSSEPCLHINLLEPSEIWPSFYSCGHCYWFDTHKMIRIYRTPNSYLEIHIAPKKSVYLVYFKCI